MRKKKNILLVLHKKNREKKIQEIATNWQQETKQKHFIHLHPKRALQREGLWREARENQKGEQTTTALICLP